MAEWKVTGHQPWNMSSLWESTQHQINVTNETIKTQQKSWNTMGIPWWEKMTVNESSISLQGNIMERIRAVNYYIFRY